MLYSLLFFFANEGVPNYYVSVGEYAILPFLGISGITNGLLGGQMIYYLGVLGSTWAAGLRERFLKRDGRLSKRSDGWLLQVETKPLGILLGQLTLGLGTIKHSWVPEFLYVEWC